MKTLKIAGILLLLVIAVSVLFRWSSLSRDQQIGAANKPPAPTVPAASRSGRPEHTATPRAIAPIQPALEGSKLLRGEWTSESELKDQGRSSPSAAYESFMWASTGGDVARTAEMFFFGPSAAQKADEIFAKLSPDKQAEYGTSSKLVAALFIGAAQRPTAPHSYQFVGDEAGAKMLPWALGLPESAANDPSYHTVQAKQRGPDGKEAGPVVVFHLTADGWKWVIPPSMIDALARRILSNPSKPVSAKARP